MNNQSVYCATILDTVTTLSDGDEPVNNVLQGIGNLIIKSGCKVFTASVLLQVSCTVMGDVTLQGADLLTQNCTSVTVVKNWV